MRRTLPFLSLLLLLGFSSAIAQDIASFEKRVTVKKLPNGLTLMVLERPEAPVFSFFTYVDAGDVQDPKGKGGLAHMFEHMAFKGTDKIGTLNYPAEKAALEDVEKKFDAYERERLKRVGRDSKRLAELQKAWREAIEKAQTYVVPNEFSEIIESAGGEDINASTSMDATHYFYSLPSNRLELWAYLESERFLHPVFREFYTERDVVHEERRMRTDSSPIGRLVEEFLATSFIAHPYKENGIGFPSELDAFSATDAQVFFKKYYIPSNMVISLVGDVKASEAMPIMEKYFSRIPKAEKPEDTSTVEPTPQKAERSTTLHEAAQPFFLEGYHRPSYLDPDDAVYDVISDLLSSGRTSRLYRALVRDKKVAREASGFSGFPGVKYPNLFAFYAVPSRGHTPAEVKDAMRVEIERLINEDVTDEELKMVKTRIRADLVRGLADNEGLAEDLATYQTLYGDWREMFRSVDRVDKVTKADIRRIAAKTFVPENRTTSTLETITPKQQPQASQPQGAQQ
jgi:predicted Zn-dependent peptidase